MQHELLDRYERAPDGSLLFDVSVDDVEAIYNDFERGTPYSRRDLDPRFANYLVECAREVGARRYAIRLRLRRAPDPARTARIRASIREFFVYLAEVERRQIRRMLRKSLLLFGIGMVILFIAVWVNHRLGAERSVVANVFAEGLTVAAWVSLWEALATFLIEWSPQRKEITTYERLAAAPVILEVAPAAGDDHNGGGSRAVASS